MALYGEMIGKTDAGLKQDMQPYYYFAWVGAFITYIVDRCTIISRMYEPENSTIKSIFLEVKLNLYIIQLLVFIAKLSHIFFSFLCVISGLCGNFSVLTLTGCKKFLKQSRTKENAKKVCESGFFHSLKTQSSIHLPTSNSAGFLKQRPRLDLPLQNRTW